MGWKYNDPVAFAVAFNFTVWLLYPGPVYIYTAHENLKASQAKGLSYQQMFKGRNKEAFVNEDVIWS